MKTKKLKWGNPLFIIFLAVAGLFGISSTLINSQINEQPVAEKVEASVGKATKDYPMIVNCWNDVANLFVSADVGIHCWGGDLEKAVTVKVEKLTDHMGTTIIPKGTQFFKIVKANSGTLPCEGWPSGYMAQWGQWSFDYAKNVVTLKSYGANKDTSGDQEYNDNKVILFKDMPLMFDTDSGVGSWWWNNDCTSYAVTSGESGYFDYTISQEWLEISRIGNTGYMYITPSTTIVSDYVIVSRNTQGTTGWDAKQNQTTNMTTNNGFNSLYTTQIESGKTYGSQNWGNKSAVETASEYGCYFMDLITCSGGGSITSDASNWGTVKTYYDNMTADVQGEVWLASGSETGSNVEKAMARYDYIVFYKQYSGYTDFIKRTSSSGKTSFSIRGFSPFNLFVGEDNNVSTIIIVVASSVALLSVTALSVLVIKKRKAKEQ